MKKIIVPIICLMMTSSLSCLEIFTIGRGIAWGYSFCAYVPGFDNEEEPRAREFSSSDSPRKLTAGYGMSFDGGKECESKEVLSHGKHEGGSIVSGGVRHNKCEKDANRLHPLQHLGLALTLGYSFDTYLAVGLWHRGFYSPPNSPKYWGGLMVASAIGAGLGYGANWLVRTHPVKAERGKKIIACGKKVVSGGQRVVGGVWKEITKPMGMSFLVGSTGLLLLWLGSRGVQK